MASEVLPTVAAGPIYSASSTLSNTYSANVVFGGNIDAGGPGPNYWKCAAGAYSGAGAYVGSKTTTLSDGTTVVSGEWLQQQFQNTGSTCGDFRMFPSVNFSSYQPTNARLLASQTGVDGSWTQLWPTTGGNGTLTSYTIYNTSAPQYAVSTTSATTYLCFRLVFTASTSSSVEVGGLWIEPLRYSSSSSQSSNTADLAFDANANTLWQSADTYSTTTGLHVGGVVTVVADGTNVKGEWLQSYYHSGVGVLNLDLAAANSGLQPSLQPSTAVVLGSAYGADGTWVRVWPADGTAAPLVYLNNVTTHFTYNGIANAVYKYVRVVFPSGSGASNVQLSGITLN
jgi:hypothetical protein